jgi:hypothetical protein
MSPYGPAVFPPIYGRIISGEPTVLANNRLVATVGSRIYYSGFVYSFGNINYVTWIGRVITGASPLVNSKKIAVVGSITDAQGQVIQGENNILA